MTREEEAKRTLRRIETEQEKLLTGHAPSEPTDDPIEILGRRIARVLSICLAAGLMFYLWITYVQQ